MPAPNRWKSYLSVFNGRFFFLGAQREMRSRCCQLRCFPPGNGGSLPNLQVGTLASSQSWRLYLQASDILKVTLWNDGWRKRQDSGHWCSKAQNPRWDDLVLWVEQSFRLPARPLFGGMSLRPKAEERSHSEIYPSSMSHT